MGSTRNLKELKNLFENMDKILSEDRRAELHRKWTNLGYMFRFQPLSIIKNYIGEQITLTKKSYHRYLYIFIYINTNGSTTLINNLGKGFISMAIDI